MTKQKLIIDRKSFLEWKFSDSDEYDNLIYIVREQLKRKRCSHC